MDSDKGKLFIGGISSETKEDKLMEHFGQYGHVLETAVKRDKRTGRSRGFAFVTFADPSVHDAVLAGTHIIDGKIVEAKRVLSWEEQHTTVRPGNFGNAKAVGASGGGNIRAKTIFVGGLPRRLTEEKFSQYFQAFGAVEDVEVVSDRRTGQPLGFGFITFASEDSVDKALEKTFHELNGKLVEVKRAFKKRPKPGSAGERPMSFCGTYQSHRGSGGNTSPYEGGMNNNRDARPQSTSGGYAACSASGYGAAGFGYGPGNSSVGYGGRCGAGGHGSGGSRGPSGAYGNPNAPTTGYVSDPSGVPRIPGNNRPSASYGFAAFGANAVWNPPEIGGSRGSSGAYGNPKAPTTGHVSDLSGVPRISGNNRPSAGYGFAAFGANAVWNPPETDVAATVQPRSQSPHGASGHGFAAFGANALWNPPESDVAATVQPRSQSPHGASGHGFAAFGANAVWNPPESGVAATVQPRSQSPHGASGHGFAAFGANALWNPPESGVAATVQPRSQSPHGASGHGFAAFGANAVWNPPESGVAATVQPRSQSPHGASGHGFAAFGANAVWNPPESGVAATVQPRSQSPHGASGHGFAAFGANAVWNPPETDVAATVQPRSQSPHGASGYGSQAHGYGGYGATGGHFGSQGGYGIDAGRDNTDPNSKGHPLATLMAPTVIQMDMQQLGRSNPSQGRGNGAANVNAGGTAGFAGGLGAVQSRRGYQQ